MSYILITVADEDEEPQVDTDLPRDLRNMTLAHALACLLTDELPDTP